MKLIKSCKQWQKHMESVQPEVQVTDSWKFKDFFNKIITSYLNNDIMISIGLCIHY